MKPQELRWVQRFASYEKAFRRLEEALMQPSLNELERNGTIQRFEFTLELSWKVRKDFLEWKGFHFKPSPKDTIRQAQAATYIQYGQALIDGLDIRNELSHDYDEEKFLRLEPELRTAVYPALKQLYFFFLSEKNALTQ